MKTSTTKLSIITLLLSVMVLFTANVWALDVEDFGTWARGNNQNLYPDPYKGYEANVDWSDIEPSNGTFDWTEIDSVIAMAEADGVACICSVNTGFSAPTWLYDNGVPEVYTDHDDRPGPYPYYLDADYIYFMDRMITAFGDHIRTHSSVARVKSVQVKTGCTGDEAPYKGTPDEPEYEIDKGGEDWLDHRLLIFGKYDVAFQHGTGQTIPLLFNDCDPYPKYGASGTLAEWNWITTYITDGLGHKLGGIGQFYQLNDENTNGGTFTPYMVDPSGTQLYSRCEADQTWTNDIFAGNIKMNFYWTALGALHCGLSRWTVTDSAREWTYNNSFWTHGAIMSKYGNQIFPASSERAFCAFRDGLNSADTTRFPEGTYGTATKDNTTRYNNIASAFSAYGADNDSVNALIAGQVNQRNVQTGFNDTGWDIFPGNHERFLHQVDANDTSVGWWRVGGITKSGPIYGRFARGFENSSSKNGIYLDLHDDMSITPTVSFTVTYYDSGTGTWALKYDATSDSQKTALSVTKTNSGDWKKAYVTVSDAYFQNRCPNSTDIYLLNTDTNDDIFHMVEVKEGISLEDPTGLVATAGDEQVSLDWDDNQEPFLDGYNVYRSTTSGSGYAKINGSLVTASAYTDSTVNNGTEYYYKVTAVDGEFESGYSNGASATPGALAAFNPTDDTYVRSDNASGNYGTSADLALKSVGPVKNSYLKFTVSDTETVSSAILRLYGNDVGYVINVHQVLDDTWSEDTMTWSNAPEMGSTLSSVTGHAAWIEFNVDGYVTGDGTYSFGLTYMKDNSDSVRSKETASDPELVVRYSSAPPPPDSTPPANPTGLDATGGTEQISLDWNDNTEVDLDGYNVYRSTTSGSGFSKINGSVVSASAYTDSTVNNDTTYYYKVAAVDTSENESGYSNEDWAVSTAPATPDAPSNLTATAVSKSQIDLEWVDNSDDEDGFKIECSEDDNQNFEQIDTVGANVTTYESTGLSKETTYYYRVRAYNGYGDSDYSNEAYDTTPKK